MSSDETVANRIDLARTNLSIPQIAAGFTFGVAIAFVLVFLQEPLAHDAMHNFRHAAGITCH